MSGDTVKFDVTKARKLEYKMVLKQVYDALEEKGYNPLDQIVGYLLSEDPGYITNHKNANIKGSVASRTLNMIVNGS